MEISGGYFLGYIVSPPRRPFRSGGILSQQAIGPRFSKTAKSTHDSLEKQGNGGKLLMGYIILIATLFAPMAGVMLGRSLTALVLVPIGFTVLASIAAVGPASGVGFWAYAISAVFAVSTLHLGYLAGACAASLQLVERNRRYQ